MKLEKIAERLLLDLEGAVSLEFVRNSDVKLDLIKDAIMSYHVEKVAPEDAQWKADQFDIFWTKYGKKVGRTPAEKKWMKLKKKDIEQAIATVDDFVRAHPEVQYRPHPVTYINQRRWEDELPGAIKVRTPAVRLNTWQY